VVLRPTRRECRPSAVENYYSLYAALIISGANEQIITVPQEGLENTPEATGHGRRQRGGTVHFVETLGLEAVLLTQLSHDII
jgi:hypothetical protein